MHRNQQGIITYIHNSSQGQFIVETYIIIILSILFNRLDKKEKVLNLSVYFFFHEKFYLLGNPIKNCLRLNHRVSRFIPHK